MNLTKTASAVSTLLFTTAITSVGYSLYTHTPINLIAILPPLLASQFLAICILLRRQLDNLRDFLILRTITLFFIAKLALGQKADVSPLKGRWAPLGQFLAGNYFIDLANESLEKAINIYVRNVPNSRMLADENDQRFAAIATLFSRATDCNEEAAYKLMHLLATSRCDSGLAKLIERRLDRYTEEFPKSKGFG